MYGEIVSTLALENHHKNDTIRMLVTDKVGRGRIEWCAWYPQWSLHGA